MTEHNGKQHITEAKFQLPALATTNAEVNKYKRKILMSSFAYKVKLAFTIKGHQNSQALKQKVSSY